VRKIFLLAYHSYAVLQNIPRALLLGAAFKYVKPNNLYSPAIIAGIEKFGEFCLLSGGQG